MCIRDRIGSLTSANLTPAGRIKDWTDGEIYRAIRDRNPEAARDAMRDHLMLAQKAQEEEELDSTA